ncbi:hypothetical protein TNCV_743251 [Trichonephila clavipes]|nr:hypothetical protein TNCV_743251 [Trichonephila clavipes]
MVLPAGQGQVPHPSIVPEFFTISQLWNDRVVLGDTRNRWRDGPVCPDVDEELWCLGPDSSEKFQNIGSVGEAKHTGRPKTSRSNVNIEALHDSVGENLGTSIRRRGQELQI